MNRNCCTNSVPYGYGGRRADVIVFPVRIIMSPTCSSRFLVGRKTRSAAALTTLFVLLPGETTFPRNVSPVEAYVIASGVPRGKPTGPQGRNPVVCSARFGGEESAGDP